MHGLSPLWRLLAAAAIALATFGLLLPGSPPIKGQLVVYCAAALRMPMEEITAGFQKQTGIPVRVQYGGSNTLLSQLALARQGDLYLPADNSYADLAVERGLADAPAPIARMTAVIGVARGNPLGVESFDDLQALRVAIANPDLAAIGRTTREQLVRAARWESFYQDVQKRGVTKPTVGDVLNDVALGGVDAGIVWDAVAAQHPQVEAVRVPELEQGVASVAVARLRFAADPKAAERFIAYLTNPKAGQAILERRHYKPAVRGSVEP